MKRFIISFGLYIQSKLIKKLLEETSKPILINKPNIIREKYFYHGDVHNRKTFVSGIEEICTEVGLHISVIKYHNGILTIEFNNVELLNFEFSYYPWDTTRNMLSELEHFCQMLKKNDLIK